MDADCNGGAPRENPPAARGPAAESYGGPLRPTPGILPFSGCRAPAQIPEKPERNGAPSFDSDDPELRIAPGKQPSASGTDSSSSSAEPISPLYGARRTSPLRANSPKMTSVAVPHPAVLSCVVQRGVTARTPGPYSSLYTSPERLLNIRLSNNHRHNTSPAMTHNKPRARRSPTSARSLFTP